MKTYSPQYTLIKYEPDDMYVEKDGIYVASGDEQDRLFKQQTTREVSAQNKPKNMYRWGEVVDSKVLKKGTNVYYSQYDADEFVENEQTYNVVLNDHLLAYDNVV